MYITSTFINPFTDFGFKKLFGEESSKPQLISFINAFLENQNEPLIVDLEFRNLEKLGLTLGDRKTIFDIYCTDEEGNHIIVELQRAKQTYFKDRMIYYSTFPIQEQGIKGMYYNGNSFEKDGKEKKVGWDYKLKAVYSIGILDFKLYDQKDDEYLHFVSLKDQNCKSFYDKLKYVFVEMPKFNKSEDELVTYLDKWFYFLKNLDSLDRIPEIFKADSIIINAFKKAKFVNMDKKVQNIYLESLKEYRDWYAVLSTAENDGIAEGLKLADEKIQKALKREEKAQKEKEKAQKEKEKAQEQVCSLVTLLLSMNTPIEIISEKTKLSIEEIEKIEEEIKH